MINSDSAARPQDPGGPGVSHECHGSAGHRERSETRSEGGGRRRRHRTQARNETDQQRQYDDCHGVLPLLLWATLRRCSVARGNQAQLVHLTTQLDTEALVWLF